MLLQDIGGLIKKWDTKYESIEGEIRSLREAVEGADKNLASIHPTNHKDIKARERV